MIRDPRDIFRKLNDKLHKMICLSTRCALNNEAFASEIARISETNAARCAIRATFRMIFQLLQGDRMFSENPQSRKRAGTVVTVVRLR